MYPVPLHGDADRIGAGGVEERDRVRPRVKLDVQVSHPVSRRPLDALLEPDPPPQIDANAIAQAHPVLLTVLGQICQVFVHSPTNVPR
jgi:hypothetical protein